MRRFFAAMAAAFLCLAMAGCRTGSTFQGSRISDEDGFRMDYTVLEGEGTAAIREAEEETVPLSEPDRRAMYEAYQFILQQIAFEHVYPDGTDTGFDGASGFIEDNHFAIWDINGDGVEELLVQFVTAPMAGNVETVYAYNAPENRADKVLAVFPAVTYYDNGMVKAEWSHGSGLSGPDDWPYDLYRYQEDTGTYDLVAEVDMWSRSADVVDYKGDPYPEDVDTEHAGTVYILTRKGVMEMVSSGTYQAWLSRVMGNAEPIQVPYQALTEENIRAVSGE